MSKPQITPRRKTAAEHGWIDRPGEPIAAGDVVRDEPNNLYVVRALDGDSALLEPANRDGRPRKRDVYYFKVDLADCVKVSRDRRKDKATT